MGLVSYAPTQAEVSVAEAPSPSAIEKQLALQHQHPAQLLPLQRLENSLLIDDDISLLDGLMRTTSVTPHSAGGVILGFEVANGAVAAKDFPVGKLRSRRCLACARCKLWWMTPEWGKSAADLPPETQFLLVEVKEGGPYAVLLPLIDSNTFRGTLRPPR
ncbi:hypothetical protein WJX82_004667 [Trebouxia sp. C0006]